MLFCEYCENFKNIYFEEHLRTAASAELFVMILNEPGLIHITYLHKIRHDENRVLKMKKRKMIKYFEIMPDVWKELGLN